MTEDNYIIMLETDTAVYIKIKYMELEKFRFIGFATEEEAIQRETKASNDANFSDGVTTKYANIIKKFDEELWLIPILIGYEWLFTQEEMNNIQLFDESQLYGV